jgi:hypothetical protein
MFGIACSALGMLSTLATGLAIDAYGPISDNAGGWLWGDGQGGGGVLWRVRCLGWRQGAGCCAGVRGEGPWMGWNGSGSSAVVQTTLGGTRAVALAVHCPWRKAIVQPGCGQVVHSAARQHLGRCAVVRQRYILRMDQACCQVVQCTACTKPQTRNQPQCAALQPWCATLSCRFLVTISMPYLSPSPHPPPPHTHTPTHNHLLTPIRRWYR